MADPSRMPGLNEDQERWLQLWSKAEDVAMHFNNMIMNYRLKAVGGVTLAAGLVGTVLLGKGTGTPPATHFFLFGAALVFLALVWGSVMAIDIWYYQRLLIGAVKEAVRLEELSGGHVQLSKHIEAEFGATASSTVPSARFRHGRGLYYMVPLAALLIAAAVSFWLGRRSNV